MNEWTALAEQHDSDAHGRASKNLTVLGDICRFLAHDALGDELKAVKGYELGRLRVTPRNGSAPSKYFGVFSIEEDLMEMRLCDSATGVEHDYIPHIRNTQALERFRQIVSSIDWSRRVKPTSGWAKGAATFRVLFR